MAAEPEAVPGEDNVMAVMERVGESIVVRLGGGMIMHFRTRHAALDFGLALIRIVQYGEDALDDAEAELLGGDPT